MVRYAGSPAARALAQAASSRAGPYFSPSPSTPWAERSLNRALTFSRSAMTAVVAGPLCSARSRHQAGVRIAKAIFSGG